MIRLNAFFVLKEGVSLDELKAVTDELVAKSRQDEGNKGYDLFQSTTNPRITGGLTGSYAWTPQISGSCGGLSQMIRRVRSI